MVCVCGGDDSKELGQWAFAFLLTGISPWCLAEQWQAQLGGEGKADRTILASNQGRELLRNELRVPISATA